MPRQPRDRTYLVATSATIDSNGSVFATVAAGPTDAIAKVAAALGTDAGHLSFSGMLSRQMTKRMKLAPGEVRRL